jgi:flagellar hook assembly protein FlgD
LSAYPNPFADQVTIRFSIFESAATNISVYSLLGQKIRQISYNYFSAGDHQLTWDGRNDAGAPVPDGIYFIRITSGNQEVTGKILKR